MTIECELCHSPATIHHEWGVYDRTDPYQEANLCKLHGDELWDRIHGAVNSLIMHYKASKPQRDEVKTHNL